MNLRTEYEAWIAANVVEHDSYGKCKQVTQQMVEAFPGLEVRRGWFHSVAWGRRGHWWCRDSEGHIVDPTARQHPDGVLFPKSTSKYEDLTDLTDDELAGTVPSGRCLDCGGDVYGGNTFCNSECEQATRAYLESGFPLP